MPIERRNGVIYMNDAEIVSLFWKRDETAILQSRRKYDSYCRRIARNILGDRRDAEECLSDTYLAAWNSIPPHRPAQLATYLGKLTRRISLKKRRESQALKRGGGELPLALDELAECVPGGRDIEDMLEEAALLELMNSFLGELDAQARGVFLRRYWYLDSIAEIAERFHFSQSRVKSMLLRSRRRLRERLEMRDI